MHTADLLELAVATVEKLGYLVRWEWLGGSGGGGCELRGRKCLFIDLAQDPAEQLACVLEVLSNVGSKIALPASLAPLITARQRAA
ncbi:MAG: hypothetical protein AB7O62_15805 [Pirellulales bacterium]